MRSLVLVFILAACAPRSESHDPWEGWSYSHEIGGLHECSDIYSSDLEQVRLRGPTCDAAGERCAMGDGVEVEVWAVPGAGDGSPWGTGQHVELDNSGCE